MRQPSSPRPSLLTLAGPGLLCGIAALVVTACDAPRGPAPVGSEPVVARSRPSVGAVRGASADWFAGVQARIRDSSHAFFPVQGAAGSFHAEVTEHRLTGRFDADKARISLGSGSPVDLRFTGLGRADGVDAPGLGAAAYGDCIAGMTEPSGACVRRIEATGEGLTAWWAGTSDGFEQGWTVDEAPGGQGALQVDVSVDGAAVLADDDGLTLQLAGGTVEVRELAAYDADGQALAAHFVPGPRGFTIEVDDATARYPVEIDPIYTTEAWSVSGVSGTTPLGSAVAGAGDVNNDGYDDVIVSASAFSSDTGRVLVYEGSSAGLSTTASTTLDGATAGDYFGRSVAGAGDVNGDGYSDIVVGADGYSSSTGIAYVYEGSASGLSSTPSATLAGSASSSFGSAVAGAGDVNKDGYADVIVGAYGYSSSTGRAYIYEGSASGLATTVSATLIGTTAGDDFGISVALAGDVNNDGYSDVVVGADKANSTGRAYIYQGSATGTGTSPSTTLNGATAGDEFGFAVSGAGDVNKDKYSDVVVGAYKSSTYGRVYVYEGSATGLATSESAKITGTSTDFGYAVAGVGDIDSDGYTDILVGCDGAGTSNTGAAYLYKGGAAGIGSFSTATLSGSASGDYFGHAVGAAGDVNGDGHPDVVVGAYGYSNNAGAAYIYSGSATGLSSTAAATLSEGGDALGTSVSDLGDVTGDGYGDVVVGVPGYNSSTGEALVYNGSATGLSTTADVTLSGEAAGDHFGHSVSGAGDVNKDGYKDVIVGAYAYGSTDTGKVYLYEGSATGISSTATSTVTGTNPSGYFGWCVAKLGNVNNDKYNDVAVGEPGYNSSKGRVYVYQGASGGLSASASQTLTGGGGSDGFGKSLAGAGDVNNDGYDDLVIGAPGYSSKQGRIYVYQGSATGISGTATRTINGASASGGLGASVSGAGDVNNDGYADIIVGSPGYSSSTGVAYVYHGSATGIAAASTTTLAGSASSYFGYSVSSAGDVNQDGYADVVVGAYGYSSSAGEVALYSGSSTGVSTTATSTITGSAATELGYSVSRAGDVDGDGYPDIIVGAPTSGGSAFLYLAYVDADGDGVPAATDCDDTDPTVSVAVTTYPDLDGDGYGDPTAGITACAATAGYVVDNTDCDDTNATAHPGGTEICDADSVDEDCNGLADDEDPAATGKTTVYTDADGDGYGATAASFCHVPATGYVAADNTDCDDSDATVHPGGTEICDAANKDEDCNGVADNNDPAAIGATPFYQDVDGDGYGGDTTANYCDAVAGWVANSADCNDASSAVSPAAHEVCDSTNTDEDCDGLVNDADPSVTGTSTFYADADADAYGDPSTTKKACVQPSGYVTNSLDCNDTNAAISPAAIEVCDAANTDEDCNGLADNNDPAAIGTASYYVDADGDGYGSSTKKDVCDPSSGYTATTGDCDDTRASVYPGATEVLADGIDENCDGTETCYVDADGDGYKSAATVVSADGDCSDAGEALSTEASDCDDSSATVHSGATEIVGDEIDEDCDGKELCYVDVDADGYRPDDTTTVVSSDSDCSDAGEATDASLTGDCNDSDSRYHPDASEADCTDPNDYNCDGSTGYIDADGDGYAACEDCDDGNASVHPGATEVCNGLDDNCDGVIDTDAVDQTDWYVDADSDGYTVDGAYVTSCDQPAGYAAHTAADCNDADPAYHPNASETDCTDPNDYNCDGSTGYVDNDGDGYAACEDCDDTSSSVYPGATEYCNGKDDDCNGSIDDSAVDQTDWYADADSDGYSNNSAKITACNAPSGYILETANDCDDANASTNPGATDIPDDGIDQNCDGTDAHSGDTGGDTSPDRDTGGDSAVIDTSGDSAGDTSGISSTKTGCACSTGGGELGWAVLLVGAALVSGRRRG